MLRRLAKLIGFLMLGAFLVAPALDVAQAQSDRQKNSRSSKSRSAAEKKKKKQQKRKPRGKSSQAIGKKVGAKLNEANDLIAAEKYDEARRLLDTELRRSDKLRSVELAQINRFYGFTYTSEEKYLEGIPYFVKAVELKALDEKTQIDLSFQLAQLYMATEQFQNSVDALNRFIEETLEPEARAYYLLAVGYTQLDDIDAALPPAKTAVELTESPKESWLRLLLNLHFQKSSYAEMLPILELMVREFPKKAYWMQLSAVYSELEDDERAMSVQQLAFTSGYLDADRDLLRLARMYLYNDIPYWAAKVVERGFEDETIEKDADSWELLANSWITAREFDRAVDPLTRAAELAETGIPYARLGQVYLEREEWNQAIDAINLGIERGNLRNPGQAFLLLGVCNFNAERYQSALSAFRRAIQHDRVKTIASQWIGHVRNTIAVKAARSS